MEDELTVVRRFYALLSAGDGAQALALLDPEIEWTEAERTPYFIGTMHGTAAIVQGLLAPLMRDFADFATTAHDFVHEAERVVSFGTYTGTSRETGLRLSAPFVHVWTVLNGRPRRFIQYSDSAAWRAASPAPLPVDLSRREANKAAVVAFYTKAVFEGDVDTAVKLYGGSSYTQHTPFAANGFDGLRTYVKWIVAHYPQTRGEIKRVFADGDYVLLHCHWTGFFGKNGDAIVDIFRVEEGRVVEHWDVIQSIPDTSLNDNTMF